MGKKFRFRVGLILAIVLLYSIVGFFVLPAIIKWQLIKRLPGLTQRQAAVEKVEMNPYALSLAVRGVSLKETNGEPFAGFDEFYANFQLSSIFRGAWTFSEIRLAHPTGNIVRDAHGQFNFANLLTNAPAPAATNKPTALPAVIIERLLVTNGNVTITDLTRAKPFHTAYGPVNLELRGFTTHRDSSEPYSFVATTGDGEKFAWAGKISVNPPRSSGEFKLAGIPLKKYSPYLAEFARVDLTDGVLGVSANYRLDANAIPLQLDVTNAMMTLANLEAKAQDTGESLLTLKNFSVSNASASLTSHEAHAPVVAIDGGSVSARRESNGQINWLALLVSQTNTSSVAASSTNGSATVPVAWKAFVDEFKLGGFAVTVEDRTTTPPAQFGLDNLNVNVRGISNQSNAPVNAHVTFNWRAGGAVDVTAKGTLMPPAGEANVAITNLALPPIQPYVEQQARLILNAGELSVNGLARYTPETRPLLQFAGDVAIAKFASMETVAYHDFLKWDALTLRGIRMSMQTNSLNVDEIKLSKLETSLVVSSNGQINVQGIVREKASGDTNAALAKKETSSSTSPADSFPIKIGALTFEKASVIAIDQTIAPRFNTSVEEFDGTIRDITWPGLTKASIDLHGKVSALAPFDIVGAVTPDVKNPFVDLKVVFKNSDLTPFDPYSGKFVGRPLNKGKLTCDLHYLVENRKLKAENVVAIDQLTFGAKNESTNATKLPVKLAVSLLKDRNGRIDLNLPVSGSLDDPQFGVGALVLKAVVNILVKVGTSPFSLLGAMFGGNGEELQSVDFVPGDIALDAAQTNKLTRLAKILYERPELNLEISASVDFANDSAALAQQKLADKLKSLYLQELTASGKPVPAADQFKLEGDDYDRMLQKAYTNAFGSLPERLVDQTPTAPATIVTNAATPKAVVATRAVKETVKGATALMKESAKLVPAKAVATNAPPSAVPTAVAPKATDASLRAELEKRLIEAAPATDADLRDLMQHRAQTVQKFLLGGGKIAAERLFLIAPKPIDPAAKGAARVAFSLD